MLSDPNRIPTAAQEAPASTLAVFLSAQRDLLRAAGCKVTGRKLIEIARMAGLAFDDKAAAAVIKSWGTTGSKRGATNIPQTDQKCGGTALAPHFSSTNTALAPQKNAVTRECVARDRVARGMRSNNLDLQAESLSYTQTLIASKDPGCSLANARLRDNAKVSDSGQIIDLWGTDVPSLRNRRLPGLTVPPPAENVAAGKLLVAIWDRLREKPRGMTQTRWRQANIRAAKDLLASGITQAAALDAFERFEREHHGEQIRTIAFLQKTIDAQYADDRRRGVTDPDRPFGQSLYTTEEALALP